MNLRSVILIAVMMQAIYGWLCLTRPESNPARPAWAAMCFCYAAWDLLFLLISPVPLSANAYFDFDAASHLVKAGIGVSFITRASKRYFKLQKIIDTISLLPGIVYCTTYLLQMPSGDAIPDNVFPGRMSVPSIMLAGLIASGITFMLVWIKKEKRKRARDFLKFFIIFVLAVISTEALLVYLQVITTAVKAYCTAVSHILIACTGIIGLAYLDYLKPTVDTAAKPLLDLLNRPIFVFDTDGNLQFANTAAKSLLQLQSATRKIPCTDGTELGSLITQTKTADTGDSQLSVTVATRKNKTIDLSLSVSAIVKNRVVCGYVATGLSQEQYEEEQLQSKLSKREQEVLALLKEGYTNKEIAEKLFITEGTVKLHAHRIYSKTRQ